MNTNIVMSRLDKIQEDLRLIFAGYFADETTAFEEHIYEELDEVAYQISRISDEVLTGIADRRLVCRIRFVDDLENDGEGFVFENKWSDEEEWGMDTLFNLIPQDDDPNHDLISYQALTKIRELQRMGVDVRFGK